jgi:hypothetical protein
VIDRAIIATALGLRAASAGQGPFVGPDVMPVVDARSPT